MTDKGQQDSFGEPDFESKKTDSYEKLKVLGANMYVAVVNRVGMNPPEQRIDEAQMFQTLVGEDTVQNKNQEQREGSN